MDELEQIGIVLEDGFVDIDLPLAAFGRDEAGVQEGVASGLHQGGRVGFKVRLEASWERQELEGGAIEELYWGRAEISSIGAESDRFLELLDQLYGTNISARKMRDRVPFLGTICSTWKAMRDVACCGIRPYSQALPARLRTASRTP